MKDLNLDCKKAFYWYGSKNKYDFLEDLVNTNTFTNDLSAIKLVQKNISQRFTKIGCDIKEYYNHESIPLLEISYGNKNCEAMTLVCHSDCVQKGDSFNRFCKNESEISGPGVIDNKAGIYMAYRLIREFKEEGLCSSVNIKVLVYPSEERGSLGFEDISKEIGKNSRYFFGLEPAESDGALIEARGGNRWYEFVFNAKALHSGRIKKSELSLGNLVIKRVSELVEKINHEDQMKLNLTSINSNDKVFNTTISILTLRLDLRFLNNSKRDEAHELIINEGFRGLDFTYEIFDDCPAMSKASESFKVIDKYFANSSQERKSVTSYGAADLNYIANENNICIDGFGAVGKNMHSKNESLEISKLESRIKSLKSVIKDLLNVYS